MKKIMCLCTAIVLFTGICTMNKEVVNASDKNNTNVVEIIEHDSNLSLSRVGSNTVVIKVVRTGGDKEGIYFI